MNKINYIFFVFLYLGISATGYCQEDKLLFNETFTLKANLSFAENQLIKPVPIWADNSKLKKIIGESAEIHIISGELEIAFTLSAADYKDKSYYQIALVQLQNEGKAIPESPEYLYGDIDKKKDLLKNKPVEMRIRIANDFNNRNPLTFEGETEITFEVKKYKYNPIIVWGTKIYCSEEEPVKSIGWKFNYNITKGRGIFYTGAIASLGLGIWTYDQKQKALTAYKSYKTHRYFEDAAADLKKANNRNTSYRTLKWITGVVGGTTILCLGYQQWVKIKRKKKCKENCDKCSMNTIELIPVHASYLVDTPVGISGIGIRYSF